MLILIVNLKKALVIVFINYAVRAGDMKLAEK
jgi:hypothetical protein